jgi:hypothetical protein
MASKDVPRRENSRKRAHYGADPRVVQENFVKNFTSVNFFHKEQRAVWGWMVIRGYVGSNRELAALMRERVKGSFSPA